MKKLPIQVILFLFFLGCLAFFINSNNISSHSLQQMGIESIVEKGHFYLEGSRVFNLQESYFQEKNIVSYKNHLYLCHQYGQYVVGSVIYFFLKEYGISYEKDMIYASGMVILLTSVLMMSIVMVLLFNISLFFTRSNLYSFVISLFMGFGTMVFPYSLIPHCDVYALFFLFVSFYFLFKKYRIEKNKEYLPLMLSGACTGLSFFMSFNAIPIIFLTVIYVASFKNRKDIQLFLLFMFLGSFPALIFNQVMFGSLFTFPENIASEVYKNASPISFSIISILSKFYMYFLSPTTSITFFSPIYLVSFIGLYLLPKEYSLEKKISSSCLFLSLFQLVLFQANDTCQYGPKCFLITVPFIFIGLSSFFIKENNYVQNLIEKGIPVHKIIFVLGIISIIIFIPGGIIGVMHCDLSKHAFFSNLSLIVRGELPEFKLRFYGIILILVASIFFFKGKQILTIEVMKEKASLFNEKYGMKWAYLSFIMLIAIWARIYDLNGLPVGLFVDEASIGYNAFSIAKTGMDEYGNSFPLYFRAFGEYKNPVLIYCAAILIKLFGSSTYVLRLTSSIFGILTVFYTYKLSSVYFDKRISLLATFLIAVSPWHILFSRQVGDASSLSLFIVLGLYLVSKGLKGNNKYILYSAIPIGISFYCYAVAKAFIPLLYLFFILINLKTILKKKNIFITWISLICLILTPLLHSSITNNSINGRFNMLFIANTPEQEKNDFNKTLPPFLAKTKSILLPAIFVRNYFKHLSLKFLLITGDGNLRHNPAGKGQLLFFTFWMSILGLICLLIKRERELYIFPIWFFLFPIPASLTWDALPHAARSICGLPVFEILAAVGFYFTISMLRKIVSVKMSFLKVCLLAVFGVFIVGSIVDLNYSLENFYKNYAKKSMNYYDYDICAISKATENLSQGNIILVPFDFNPVSILFLQKIDPYKFINKMITLNYVSSSKKDTLNSSGKNIISVIRPWEYKEGELLSYIYNEVTGEPIFEIRFLSKPLIIRTQNYKPEKIGGLTANYFDGTNFEKLILTRIDPKIDFNFNWDSPDSQIKRDNFSVKWVGWIHAEQSGLYRFITNSDNGIRLTVAEKSIINDWNDHSPATNLGEIYLSSGWHTLLLEYNEVGGTAFVKLEWQIPGGVQEVVPSESLSPDSIFH